MGEGGRGVRGIVDLPGTSSVIGLWFAGVFAGTAAYAGSPPIAGVIRLTQIEWDLSRGSAFTTASGLQLALATQIPSTGAQIDAGEQLFPYASTDADSPFALRHQGVSAGFRLSLNRLLYVNGRRIVARFTNASTSTVAQYVALVVHRVVSCDEYRSGGFLAATES